jgi:hypothetical protein
MGEGMGRTEESDARRAHDGAACRKDFAEDGFDGLVGEGVVGQGSQAGEDCPFPFGMVKGQVVLLLEQSDLPRQFGALSEQAKELLVNLVNALPPIVQRCHPACHHQKSFPAHRLARMLAAPKS